MDQTSIGSELASNESKDSKVPDAGNQDFVEFERRRMESTGGETDAGEETQSISERSNYLHIPYGFQSRGSYKHASKNCEIVGGILINKSACIEGHLYRVHTRLKRLKHVYSKFHLNMF